MSEKDYTSAELDRLVERGTKFVGGISQVPSIRAALNVGGYNEQEHRRGWDLVLTLLGYHTTDTTDSPVQVRQREAAAALDQWDGPSFDRSRAALEHRYPAQ